MKKYIGNHKNIYRHTERGFDKLTSVATPILSNSITFIIALSLVVLWLLNKRFYTQDIHARIGDIILGVTFLSLFIIQKSFNRFSGSLHLKVNELVASHEPANNAVINAEIKTYEVIADLSREYSEKAEQIKEDMETEIISDIQQIKRGILWNYTATKTSSICRLQIWKRKSRYYMKN